MLPSDDTQYLASKGYEYTCAPGGSGHLLVIKDYPLPPRFSLTVTDLMIDIPSGYPDAGLDMFWVCPEIRVAATGAFPPNADQFEAKLSGLSWQRFSRHGYPWRPGSDSLAAYLTWIRRSLERDVGIAAA
jgi:Prokaryotic E2 family E